MKRFLTVTSTVMAVLCALAACGSDSTRSDSTTAPASTTATTDATTDASSPSAGSTSSAPSGSATPDAPAAFPAVVVHKFGTTAIDSEPVRVVSVGYTDQDVLLALGVTPVGIREWYGAYPYATWPWAQEALGDATPTVLTDTEIDFEAVAALVPDLIVGVSSGMTDNDYALLSKIAPTIAQPADYVDYGTPWQVATQMIGDALGRRVQADEVVARIEGLYAGARAAHPEFAGATAAVAFVFDDKPGAYASQDSRSRMISDLGFIVPDRFDELAGDSFYFTVSQEDLSVLDTDALIWISSEKDSTIEQIAAQVPLRNSLRAVAEGREVLTDYELTGAFSFASPLSIPYALQRLVPELAAAVDGDPATVVPSLADPTGAVPTERTDTTAVAADTDDAADEAAASDAWATVFDSTSTYEDKAEHLADAPTLRRTIDAYATTGSTMGGITLVPTAADVDGDTATITYDVMFAGTAAYTGLTGAIERVEGTWVVGRDEFCGFMASARTPCE